MKEVDYYEHVRLNLVLGPLQAPKHKKIIELMKVFWTEEDIKILYHFDKVGNWVSGKQLEEKTGIPKVEIKRILARSLRNGTLVKKGTRYSLIPLLPGIFEKYFIVRKDIEENQKKAAKLYRDIMKEISPQKTYESEERGLTFTSL